MFAIKTIKYLFEALFVYFSFLLIFLIGLKNSRILFSYIFSKIGPVIKSTNIVNNNLQQVFGEQDKNTIKDINTKMWFNYGKIFVEYIYLRNFKDKNNHIVIKGKNILTEIKKKISQLFLFPVILLILN
tara:strand:+ start:154 stop:540 length:387 start_codon:yes stop_codon:yes gene_type:complete